MDQPQVMRGAFRWLPPEEGGRSPISGTRFAATARLEAEPPSEDWSIVIDGMTPGSVESEVQARWLVWPNVDLAVVPGSVLQVLEGPKVVARLEVREVTWEDA